MNLEKGIVKKAGETEVVQRSRTCCMVPFPFRHLRLSIIVNFGVHIFQPTSFPKRSRFDREIP